MSIKQYLSDTHLADLRASGLTDETIEGRGYITAQSDKSAADMSASDEYTWALAKNQLRAGLVLPCYAGNGQADRAMIKPDTPDIDADGKARKYLSPRGVPQLFDTGFSPLPDADKRPLLVFTEGIKKGDCIRQLFGNAVVIALASTSGALTNKSGRIRPDIFLAIEDYLKAKCDIVLCFDTDIATNAQVWAGVDKMRASLAAHDVPVRVAQIPPTAAGDTTGIDDYAVRAGDGAARAIIQHAQEGMPPAPVGKSGRATKSAEQKECDEWLADYRFYLDTQRENLTDAALVALWCGENAGDMLFDDATGMPFILSPTDRIYARARKDVPIGNVQRWVQGHIDSGKFLTRPNAEMEKAGTHGRHAYRMAIKARASLTDKMGGTGKAKNVADMLRATPMLNTSDFCNEKYAHLFPLTGGMSIDFSQPPGADSAIPYACPLVTTPTEARFTWCSPITAGEYAAAGNRNDGVSELFDDFLVAISDGDNDIPIALLGFLGYCLHGHRKQRFFTLYGEGRNGKGVLLRVLSHLLGAGAYNGSPRCFVGKDARHDAHWLDHRYRRAVLCPDPAGYVNDSRLLPYTGGDEMPAEVKGGDTLTFQPTGALIFHGQANRIHFRVADVAIAERLHAIKLTRQFSADEQDNTLESRLRDDAAQILARLSYEAHEYHQAISGYRSSEDFRGEHTWRAGRNMLLTDANNVARFVEDANVYMPQDSAEKSDVSVPNFLAHYSQWCRQNDEHRMQNRNGDVIKALRAAFPFIRTRRGRDENMARHTFLDGLYFQPHVPDADKDAEGDLADRAEWTKDASD